MPSLNWSPTSPCVAAGLQSVCAGSEITILNSEKRRHVTADCVAFWEEGMHLTVRGDTASRYLLIMKNYSQSIQRVTVVNKENKRFVKRLDKG